MSCCGKKRCPDCDYAVERVIFWSEGYESFEGAVLAAVGKSTGARGGAAKSARKREAVRNNGSLGGRPTKAEANAIKNWDACVGLMDDDLREQVHDELAPCSEFRFLRRYAVLHQQKFGEAFACIEPGGNW